MIDKLLNTPEAKIIQEHYSLALVVLIFTETLKGFTTKDVRLNFGDLIMLSGTVFLFMFGAYYEKKEIFEVWNKNFSVWQHAFALAIFGGIFILFAIQINFAVHKTLNPVKIKNLFDLATFLGKDLIKFVFNFLSNYLATLGLLLIQEPVFFWIWNHLIVSKQK